MGLIVHSDLGRILSILYHCHRLSPFQLEVVQGALRAYQVPLLRQVRVHLEGEAFLAQEVARRLWTCQLPFTPIGRQCLNQAASRQALEALLTTRERDEVSPLEHLFTLTPEEA